MRGTVSIALGAVALCPLDTLPGSNQSFVAILIVVHAWGYRRYVLASLPKTYKPPRTPQDELKFTQKKIEANFSNFSAWHCRTTVLGGLWDALPAEEVHKAQDDEFEFVRQALWTDPSDQSGWLYHRWLVAGRGGESISSICWVAEVELRVLAHPLV